MKIHLTCRITKYVFDNLNEVAKKLKLSRSACVELALQEFIRKHL